MRKAFSLIELLVVIAIIVILTSLISPSFNKVLEQSRSITCQTNLKSVYLTEDNFFNDHGNSIYSRNKNFTSDQDRWYWNSQKSALSSYLNYQKLECPTDPYIKTDQQYKFHRDGVSYGRNSWLENKNINKFDVDTPHLKIFYADSGHRFSTPIERSQASRRNLSSSLYIHPLSNWDNEGIFNRHLERNANVLYFDSHVETAFDIYLNIPESLNYNYDDSIYNLNWSLRND